MDKLTIISGALFLAADIFAVVSLAMPDWIVSDIGGKSVIELLRVLSSSTPVLSHSDVLPEAHYALNEATAVLVFPLEFIHC